MFVFFAENVCLFFCRKCVFLSLQKMPGSVGAVAAAKKKKKSGTEHLEKAFEKADISSDGKVSFL